MARKSGLLLRIKNSTILMLSLKRMKSLKTFYRLETDLWQNWKLPEFTYSVCGSSSKHRERFLKFRGIGDLKPLYRNELDKTCFAHDAAYSDSKDLRNRTTSDKILNNKIAKNRGYDGYQEVLATMIYQFFVKKRGS